tara:strand:+ start:87 stop:542 length:456 start_codon:yes stop_codon:yes gene_type:complete
MDTGKELIRMLAEQKDHYDALKHVVVRQATHIETMDVGKLASDTAEVRGLMRKVRDLDASIRPLRQSWGNMGLDRDPADRRDVESVVGEVRGVVEEIQEIKDRNATMLQERMGDLRKQMAGLQTQGKAAHAYYGPRKSGGIPPSKFIDQAS